MWSESTIGLIGLFLALGGQYALLFQIYRSIGDIRLEFATCPYHKKGGKSPAGDD